MLDSGRMPTAGELDQRVIVSRNKGLRDSTDGSIKDDVQEVGRYWARLDPISNSNLNVGKGFADSVNHQLTLRYCSAIDNKCSVTHRGLTYQVDGVIHDPKRAWTLAFLTLIQS